MTVDRSLVLGASGFVGRRLLRALGPEKAIGTWCSAPLPGAVRFDALTDDIGTLLDEHGPFRRGYILMAESRIDRCAGAPERTYALNVESVRRVIDALHDRDILPVFASTDCVFDGARGGYVEADAANPILTYGRHKRDVERHLEACGLPYVVARLSKVVDADPAGSGMLGEWIRGIRGRTGKPLRRRSAVFGDRCAGRRPGADRPGRRRAFRRLSCGRAEAMGSGMPV